MPPVSTEKSWHFFGAQGFKNKDDLAGWKSIKIGDKMKTHLNTTKLFSALILATLLSAGISHAGDLEVAKDRLHQYLKGSAATGYQDQNLSVSDAAHYHQYNVTFDTATKEFSFDLPNGNDLTVFVASSNKLELLNLIEVDEQSNPERYLGSCNTCFSIPLMQTEATRHVKLKVGFDFFQAQTTDKDGWVAVYVFSKS